MGSWPSKEEIEKETLAAENLKKEAERRKKIESKLQNAKKELELKRKAEAEKELEKKQIELLSRQQDYNFQLQKLDMEANHELKKDFQNKLSSTWELMVEKDYSAHEVSYVTAVVASAYTGTIDSNRFQAIEAKVSNNKLEARKRAKEIVTAITNNVIDEDDGISLDVVCDETEVA